MTLKERLEAVWRLNGCSSPCHINIWFDRSTGYLKYAHLNLFWKHGKLLGPKKQKVKGKGWTWLCKNYGMYSRMLIK